MNTGCTHSNFFKCFTWPWSTGNLLRPLHMVDLITPLNLYILVKPNAQNTREQVLICVCPTLTIKSSKKKNWANLLFLFQGFNFAHCI